MTLPNDPNPEEGGSFSASASASAHTRAKDLTIAVMQPYFVPYGGYFRLFAEADLVVMYDCVQFPRRGFVHRNRLPDAKGAPGWLTLPLKKATRDTRIVDLAFADDAENRLRRRARAFPLLAPLVADADHPLARQFFDLSMSPVDYIIGWLETACRASGAPFHPVRSSTIGLPDHLRGEDRILEIARTFGATRYLNAPGGRELYHAARFADRGMELAFLPDYEGPQVSILENLLNTTPVAI